MPQNSPKTVLYLTPSVRLLGARRSLLALATSLDPERWRPIVCGQTTGDLAEALKPHDVPFEVVKMGWWRKGKYFLWRPFAISRLSALIRRVGADLVHCNEIYPNPYAVRSVAQVGTDLGRRVPVLTHMRLSVSERMVRNYDLIRADKIVVPSAKAGEDFNVWPDKEERVRVIPNGVNLDEFSRGRTRSEARRVLGIDPDGALMMVIGQIGPRKGGDLVIDAFERIAAEFPDAKLLFVGNPHRGQEEFERELRHRTATDALAGRVIFHGYTQDILPYYEAMDVNILVSHEEGFGRTIIEAGALANPTLGSLVGGIPELIVDGKTGLLIEDGDAAGLAEAMKRLLTDPSLVKSMGEMAFRRTAQSFSIRSHTEQMMDLYDSLLAEGD